MIIKKFFKKMIILMDLFLIEIFHVFDLEDL